jgi:hypothetical protein
MINGIEICFMQNDLFGDFGSQQNAFEYGYDFNKTYVSIAGFSPYKYYNNKFQATVYNAASGLNTISTIDIPRNKYIENAIETHRAAQTSTTKFQYIRLNYGDKTTASGVYRVQNNYGIDGLIYGFHRDNASDGTAYGELIATHFFVPDYITAGHPRLWLPGEEIPYILTAKLNGIEHIIKEGKYIIKGNIILAIGNADNVSLNTIHLHNSKDYNWMGASRGDTKGKNVQTSRHHGVALYESCESAHTGGGSGVHHFISRYLLTYTIRINEQGFKNILDNDISEINLYVAEGDSEKSVLRSIGILKPQLPPPGFYSLPKAKIDDYDYSRYRLVHSFKTTGSTEQLDWQFYRGETRYSNGWFVDNLSAGGYIWAVPFNYTDMTNADYGKPFPDMPVLAYGYNTYGLLAPTPAEMEKLFTPDFTLWDYPLSAPPLNLQYSGREWKGKGAGLIAIIKGITFLGQTIDQNGIEESGTVRYPLIQSGRASRDFFPKENEFQIGQLGLTCLTEFREQLIGFSRENMYRIALNNPYDPSTWEFLDTNQGTGTFSPKTVCVTPYGLIFCADNGIWLTDGRMPTSLTDNPEAGLMILSTYQKIMMDKPYIYTYLNDIGRIPTTDGWNQYAELSYDHSNDELILSSPVMRNDCIGNYPIIISEDPENYYDWTHELRLIFNFASKNWRIETIKTKGDYYSNYNIDPHRIKSFSRYARLHLGSPDYIATRLNYVNTQGQLSFEPDAILNIFATFGKKDRNNIVDTFRLIHKKYYREIRCSLITHELGDSMNDMLLHSMIISGTPRDKFTIDGISFYGFDDYSYFSTVDPYFTYELRSKTYNEQNLDNIWENLIDANMMARGGQNPFNSRMQSIGNMVPSGQEWTDVQRIPDEYNSGRESIILSAPLRTPFRHSRFRWCSIVVAKLRGIQFDLRGFKRKHV